MATEVPTAMDGWLEAPNNVGSGIGAPVFFFETQTVKMAKQELFVDMLGHDIRAIVLAGNLNELEVAPSDALLDPEVRDGKMPYAAKSSSSADADCSC